MTGYGFNTYAAGNLVTKSFVKGTSGYPGKMTQAGANDLVVGAVGGKLKYPQGLGGSATLAAEAGDPVDVLLAPALAQVTLGGTVNETQHVKSDASGFAVAATLTGTTLQNVAGICWAGGASGEVGIIQVWIYKFIPALS